jgi:hypothetical protein
MKAFADITVVGKCAFRVLGVRPRMCVCTAALEFLATVCYTV